MSDDNGLANPAHAGRSASSQDSLSEALGREAAPHLVSFRGRRYQVRLVDQDAKTAWERWLRQNAYRTALESTGDADVAARTVTQMAMLKQLRWGSVFSRQMLASEDGGIAFAAYLMRCREDDVRGMALDAAAGPELRAALEAVVLESFPQPETGPGAGDQGPGGNQQEAAVTPDPIRAAPARPT